MCTWYLHAFNLQRKLSPGLSASGTCGVHVSMSIDSQLRYASNRSQKHNILDGRTNKRIDMAEARWLTCLGNWIYWMRNCYWHVAVLKAVISCLACGIQTFEVSPLPSFVFVTTHRTPRFDISVHKLYLFIFRIFLWMVSTFFISVHGGLWRAKLCPQRSDNS